MSTLPEYFLFRFEFTVKRVESISTPLAAETLSADYQIPFVQRYPLPTRFGGGLSATGNDGNAGGEKESKENASFDFRIGWLDRGLVLTAILSGRSAPPVCDPARPETCDGLRFFFDTRDVRDIHRATKYCHRFLFLPTDTTVRRDTAGPCALWLPIHRAKAIPNPVDVGKFRLASEIGPDTWKISAFLPAETLTGYDPKDHSRMALWFFALDSQLGRFALQHPGTFPAEEDPSLWSAVELAGEE